MLSKEIVEMKIAIILISYNQEEYIVDALDGILNQSREPDEVVIADDGSTDATQQMIADYVKRHNLQSKWVLLLSKNNRGINKNFSNAIANSTSDIIIGLSGDDISLPNRCEVVEDIFFRNEDVSMIVTSGLIINEAGITIGNHIEPDGYRINDFSRLIKNGFGGHNPVGAAFRNEIFTRFPALSSSVPNEDDQITFRALLLGGILCSSTLTYKYRKHEKSISSWNTSHLLSKSEYADRYFSNLKVRAENYRIWDGLCEAHDNTFSINAIRKQINSKIEFLEWLATVGEKSLVDRFKSIIFYRKVLCKRDVFYSVTGRSGVIFWSILRDITSSLKWKRTQ